MNEQSTPPSNNIHIVITGGTIDSYYNPSKDGVEPLQESCVPAFLSGLKLYEELEFTQVCMKDSRALTQEDLDNLVKAIQESPHTKIIVTHGTYTMPDSARYLKNHLKRDDQTIIFTGSMIPITGFSPSDAPFNLGYSMAMVRELKPGIHVCMNGRIFDPIEVAKLISEGRFISVFIDK